MVYSEPPQTSKMEHFAKIVIGLQPLTVFAKHSLLDLWQHSDTHVMYEKAQKVYLDDCGFTLYADILLSMISVPTFVESNNLSCG